MFDRVYIGSAAKEEGAKATHLVQNLYNLILENPEILPKMPDAAGNDINRLAIDYIAGMTDTYAIYIYKENFIPKRWYK
jgi:dGTPase